MTFFRRLGRIAAALVGAIRSYASQYEAATATGRSQTWICRNGESLDAWVRPGFWHLVHQHPDLAEAVLRFCESDDDLPDPRELLPRLMQEIQDDGEIVASIAAKIADGQVDPHEARHLYPVMLRRFRRDRVLLRLLDERRQQP